MLLAIESFVRLFESLLAARPGRLETPPCHADNDNVDMSDDERRWASYR